MIKDSEPLPANLAPIWLEGVVTAEYENDTLPLLFAPEEVFNEYYDALIDQNEDLMDAIRQVMVRNQEARQERAEGCWQECLNSLSTCLSLRQCIFNADDIQYTKAVHHFLFTIVTFATFFLKESLHEPRRRRILLNKSYELFSKAMDMAPQIPNKQEQNFFRAIVTVNIACYYYRKKKLKVAAQYALTAARTWEKSKVKQYAYYFNILASTGLLISMRYTDAAKALRTAIANLPPLSSGPATPAASIGEAEATVEPPIAVRAQLLTSAVPVLAATAMATYHNMALTQIGLRKYPEAAEWCAKSMDVASAHRAYLKVSHPWIQAIRKVQEYCIKISFSANYNKFKMKFEETNIKEFQMMQKLILKTKTMPVFNTIMTQFGPMDGTLAGPPPEEQAVESPQDTTPMHVEEEEEPMVKTESVVKKVSIDDQTTELQPKDEQEAEKTAMQEDAAEGAQQPADKKANDDNNETTEGDSETKKEGNEDQEKTEQPSEGDGKANEAETTTQEAQDAQQQPTTQVEKLDDAPPPSGDQGVANENGDTISNKSKTPTPPNGPPPKANRRPNKATSFLPNIDRTEKHKPLAILRVYGGMTSQRRLTEDFFNKRNIRAKGKRAKDKVDDTPTAAEQEEAANATY